MSKKPKSVQLFHKCIRRYGIGAFFDSKKSFREIQSRRCVAFRGLHWLIPGRRADEVGESPAELSESVVRLNALDS
jgi:hypothetical protein